MIYFLNDFSIVGLMILRTYGMSDLWDVGLMGGHPPDNPCSQKAKSLSAVSINPSFDRLLSAWPLEKQSFVKM